VMELVAGRCVRRSAARRTRAIRAALRRPFWAMDRTWIGKETCHGRVLVSGTRTMRGTRRRCLEATWRAAGAVVEIVAGGSPCGSALRGMTVRIVFLPNRLTQ
jgi:hypothetical protein